MPVPWLSNLGVRGRAPRGESRSFCPRILLKSPLSRLSRHRDRLAVAVCPRDTCAISGRLPPVSILAAAGIRVAIGTDSRASNPDLSVLAECHALVGAGVVPAEQSLRMATGHGAWAHAHDDRAGRILPGRPADLIVLRPQASLADPFAAAIDPGTAVVATLRRGRVITGSLFETAPSA